MSESKEFTWDEIRKHNTRDSRWIVIDNNVYDVTKWSYKHPGGHKIITHYAGQDASEAFRAFHIDMVRVQKYLTLYKIGSVSTSYDTNVNYSGPGSKREQIMQDFEQLREVAKKMNLFRASTWFYVLTLSHIIALEMLGFGILWYFGTSWPALIASMICYSTCQAQASWLQHDCGHLSIFGNLKLDHAMHYFVMSFIKGASTKWWCHLHYQHHAKPNIINKDPDTRLEKLFVLGTVMPVQVAKEQIKTMPYNWQHRYFFFIPPLLFPAYFQVMTVQFAITRRHYWDLFMMSLMYIKFTLLTVPVLGITGALVYFEVMRILESAWFTWVAQSNHIPMDIVHDTEEPWLSLQLNATCDIEKSFFNDWFTGHLNFQIEHHLFPTMPRHNLYKIAPYVRTLCAKHDIKYIVKPMFSAFCDIIKSLYQSGQIWYSAYQVYHMM